MGREHVQTEQAACHEATTRGYGRESVDEFRDPLLPADSRRQLRFMIRPEFPFHSAPESATLLSLKRKNFNPESS